MQKWTSFSAAKLEQLEQRRTYKKLKTQVKRKRNKTSFTERNFKTLFNKMIPLQKKITVKRKEQNAG